MHCGVCGDIKSEVRPCTITKADAKVDVPAGDCYLCRKCAYRLTPTMPNSAFITWIGVPCDECRTMTAFFGDIDDWPTGIVCDECDSELSAAMPYTVDRGLWLCEPCYEKSHLRHRRQQLRPILDWLANI